MQPEAVNLQTALGIATCNTLQDVNKLLNDLRMHERTRVSHRIRHLIETSEVTDIKSLLRWLDTLIEGLKLDGDGEVMDPIVFKSKVGRIRH